MHVGISSQPCHYKVVGEVISIERKDPYQEYKRCHLRIYLFQHITTPLFPLSVSHLTVYVLCPFVCILCVNTNKQI